VSRKHWGGWHTPLRWRCELSYALYRLNPHERARHHARRAETAFTARSFPSAIWEFLLTGLYSPRMARDRLLYGWLASRGVRAFERWAIVPDEFTGRYEDGWIGPRFREVIAIPASAHRIDVVLSHFPQPRHRKVVVQLRINGNLVGRARTASPGDFTISADVADWRARDVAVEVITNSSFTPGEASGDLRRLSLKLNSVSVV